MKKKNILIQTMGMNKINFLIINIKVSNQKYDKIVKK